MIEVLEPKIGEKIYDGACGSAGFLCEAFQYLIKLCKTARERETLQKKMLFGKEKKALPFIIGTMNMILHGVETPNILLRNIEKLARQINSDYNDEMRQKLDEAIKNGNQEEIDNLKEKCSYLCEFEDLRCKRVKKRHHQ